MPTTMIWPDFLEVEDWRQIVKNNRRISFITFVLWTNETWLPLILSQAGFFPSNGEVKKNRPDFWRDVNPDGEEIAIGKWANIRIIT